MSKPFTTNDESAEEKTDESYIMHGASLQPAAKLSAVGSPIRSVNGQVAK